LVRLNSIKNAGGPLSDLKKLVLSDFLRSKKRAFSPDYRTLYTYSGCMAYNRYKQNSLARFGTLFLAQKQAFLVLKSS